MGHLRRALVHTLPEETVVFGMPRRNAIRSQRRRGKGNKFFGRPFGGNATFDFCVVSAKREVHT
eukprot:9592926-Alexandrium_andersonii.AAC.1